MAVRCRWLQRVLDAGDEIGCVDTLRPLRVFISMELEEYPADGMLAIAQPS